MMNTTHYGLWTKDNAGLPCFDLDMEANFHASAPFKHLMSTGRLGLFADQWGNVNPFTCEGGYAQFAPNEYSARSGLCAVLFPDNGDPVSLAHSELSPGGKKIRYGVGYAVYSGAARENGILLEVTQSFLTPPDDQGRFLGRLSIRNLSDESIQGTLKIQSDVLPFKGGASFPAPYGPRRHETGDGWIKWLTGDELRAVCLCGPAGWEGHALDATLNLRRHVTLAPGETFHAVFSWGCGGANCSAPDQSMNADSVARAWAGKLLTRKLRAPEDWMVDEAVWTTGQLFSFTQYDSHLGEHFIALGGYGWPLFNIREVAETAMPLAHWDAPATRSNLRWYAKLQHRDTGRFRHAHNFRADSNHPPHALDTEPWFLLGATEAIATTGETGWLDEPCPYWDGGAEESLWQHLVRAHGAVMRHRGDQGLVLFPDWDDFLSGVGRGGKGQSVMNSGIAARAFDSLAQFARARGENELSAQFARDAADMRAAVGAAFDTAWFLRGYKDDGSPFCSHAESRVSLVAQAFAVLGKCGTPEQRRTALCSALEHCDSPIGLMLMSRPVSCPPPPEISLCPIPRGEGENAGVWPQTIHWFIWALAEEGLIDEAWDCWRKASLRNHSHLHPGVPFGIYNGPDCYSSKWAGSREGWTQIQLIDRAKFSPMNPMVAWQAFSLIKINQHESTAVE